jgi:hypothetical protein
MIDPFTLLIACAFAATFLLAVGLDIGYRMGHDSKR